MLEKMINSKLKQCKMYVFFEHSYFLFTRIIRIYRFYLYFCMLHNCLFIFVNAVWNLHEYF